MVDGVGGVVVGGGVPTGDGVDASEASRDSVVEPHAHEGGVRRLGSGGAFLRSEPAVARAGADARGLGGVDGGAVFGVGDCRTFR